MRVGIIGIGDICKKAYMPITTSLPDIELILCTRNKNTLDDLKDKYRIKESVTSVEQLIESNIDCAFVHSSTDSHYEICKKLLENNIHVYVDKPISYKLEEALELTKLAKIQNKILMIGFNRRHAPMIKDLKSLGKADIIIIEKNRVNHPGEPRVFVYDDYIHVLDTLRFLMEDDYNNITVDYHKDEAGLKNVVVKLSNGRTTAIGLMNRDNGIVEETIEYMASGKKAIVKGLVHTTSFQNNTTTIKEFGDWENTLVKRGFYSVIDTFLNKVKNNDISTDLMDDCIKTHLLCEEVVKNII